MPSGGPIVFLGTGEFSVPTLKKLVKAGERVALVVTQPDRPKGRGRLLAPTPAKAAALEMGLEVFSPERVNDTVAVEKIASYSPEFLVVVDYGQLLSRDVLFIAPGGALNLHPSLLPRHRGPSPVAWAILEGDSETGVTTMLLDEGMDSGPILMQRAVPFGPAQTLGSLSPLLAQIGAEMMAETVAKIRAGEIWPVPQDHERATFSKLIDKSLQMADFSLTAKILAARINALSPAPAVRGWIRGKMVKFLAALAVEGSGEPGRVIEAGPEGFKVACGEGAVLIGEVLPEGRGAMSAADFARGGGIAAGNAVTVSTP